MVKIKRRLLDVSWLFRIGTWLALIFISFACANNQFTKSDSSIVPKLSNSPEPSFTPTQTVTPTITSSPLPTFEPTQFCLREPGGTNPSCFSTIDHPYSQTEFNVSRSEDDVLNFNLSQFVYSAATSSCTLLQTKYEFDTVNDNPTNLAELYPPIYSNISIDLSQAACRHARIASLIKSAKGGNCNNLTSNLSSSEFLELKRIKMTTPQSGGEAQYILLEASLLQSDYANILPPTINLDMDCRCWYDFRYADENDVHIMALQEHCAAHFTDWNF